MYFESGESSSKPRRSTRGSKNENRVVPQSQSGQLKLSKSRELVPGTYQDEQDDVIEIPESPSPEKKSRKLVLGRKPKKLDVSDVKSDDLFEFDNSRRGSALKVQNQKAKEPARRRPAIKKIQTEDETSNDSTDLLKVQKKATTTFIIDSDSDDDFFNSKSYISTSTAESTAKSVIESPPKQRTQKRQIEEDPDDIFEIEAPKRSRQSNSTINNLSRTLQSQTISSQLETVGTKRASDQDPDDLFSFGPKRSKIADQPKLRRNLRKAAEAPAEKADSVIEISDTLSTTDMHLDLEPGLEIDSGEWLSKDSIVKKEEDCDDDNDEPDEGSETKKFFNVIPVSINLDDTTEVRGKSFKKKINYKKQTTIVEVKPLELKDCNLLYPTVTYD